MAASKDDALVAGSAAVRRCQLAMVLCGDVRDGCCRPLTRKRGYFTHVFLLGILFENLCHSYLSKGNFARFLANKFFQFKFWNHSHNGMLYSITMAGPITYSSRVEVLNIMN